MRRRDGIPAVTGHHRLIATRAHLLESAGEYSTAAGRTNSLPERRHLTARARRLSGGTSG